MANNQLKVLRRKNDFETLKLRGSRVVPCRWLLLSYQINDLDHCRFGWTIGRKVGNAVVRNRFKRWCRNFFRSAQLSTNKQLDINVIIKPGTQDFYRELSHSDFVDALGRGWKSIQRNVQ